MTQHVICFEFDGLIDNAISVLQRLNFLWCCDTHDVMFFC